MAPRNGNRHGQHRGPNLIPPKPKDIIVQQQPVQPQQPPQPPVPMDDEALAILWAPHKAVLAEAEKSAALAVPFEEAAKKARENAADKRAEAERLQRQAEQALTDAADLEAAAGQHDREARPYRQDEENHRKNAGQVANAIRWLAESNGKTHPQVRQEREAQMAALNAQPAAPNGQHLAASGQHMPLNGHHRDALTAPLNELVATGHADTAPFAPPEARQ